VRVNTASLLRERRCKDAAKQGTNITDEVSKKKKKANQSGMRCREATKKKNAEIRRRDEGRAHLFIVRVIEQVRYGSATLNSTRR